MLNPVIDNLPGLLARVSAAGDTGKYQFGRFGWFLGPDGTNVELWEPG